MICAEAARQNFDRARIALLGEIEVLLALVGGIEAPLCRGETGKAVETRRDIGMVRAEDALADRERALQQRLGFVITAFDLIKGAEVVKRVGKARIIGTKRSLARGNNLLH